MDGKKISILAEGLSDKGLVREINEDRIVIDKTSGIYLVADGLGGHQAGEVASRIAAEVIAKWLAGAVDHPGIDPEQVLHKAIEAAHRTIREESLRTITQQGMGSTVCILWKPDNGSTLWLAHVGDSRAYLLRGAVLIRLTEDHTVFNRAKKAGLLGSDPSTYPPRNILSQALGSSKVVSPDIASIDLQDGDILLLCSDGLTDMLPDETISTLLLSGGAPDDICQKLVQAALANGGRDNLSVIILRIQI